MRTTVWICGTLGPPIIAVYFASSIGSIFGGWLFLGSRMKAGHTVNYGRKFAMIVCAILVQPLILVP